ncbi:PIG-L family deacetylase [Tepidimonas charontis]|uniref:N-acetyl-alpha-D-glucosaminyl L-malate deacetylase 1 n=1 Tax=Tepidimonas charontis TaxID=2267262 RepID=A0A554XCH8_9BURK|nr:PIG-L family deacetylase [Tepidimonas charontis]TSE33464.1 N-acetyl-alpha-D-glucosaminyl L-malate deacetylase 1 [Tepidimonas charontis]
MLDRQLEGQTFPQPFDIARYRRYLVFAPHADDEVFGCGGTLALAVRAGASVQVVVVTDGRFSHPDRPADEVTSKRREEARAAAALLGYELVFWDVSDRNVRLQPSLVERLCTTLVDYRPDIVFCTPPTEPHPDHQALGLALMAAIQQLSPRPDLAWYESGHLLIDPTHLCDITAVFDQKRAAVRCFTSQEALASYAQCIEAKDRFRTLTLGRSSLAAEAFYVMNTAVGGFMATVPGLHALRLHHDGRAATPADLPLVSVLVRTIGDPRLEEAVASVLAQTYRPIEIVVVAADGRDPRQRFPALASVAELRIVNTGVALTRPQAANAALRAARGEVAIFLDDDDLFLPHHLESLVDVLRAHPEVDAVHANAHVVDSDGRLLFTYDLPFDRDLLYVRNRHPIHTVAFRMRLVHAYGCHFDESLQRLEDWDFWLQVSQRTDMLSTGRVSAIYRNDQRSRAVEAIDEIRMIRQRWIGTEQISGVIDALVRERDELEQRWHSALCDNQTLRARLSEPRSELSPEAQVRIAEAEARASAAERSLRLVERSVSFRLGRWLTAPLRWLRQYLHGEGPV